MKKNNACRVQGINSSFDIDGGLYYYPNLYISTDEAVKEITKANEVLQNEVDKLQSEIKELSGPKIVPWPASMADVKQMSIWEFLKWKKR